jgi:hypothetical protein
VGLFVAGSIVGVRGEIAGVKRVNLFHYVLCAANMALALAALKLL